MEKLKLIKIKDSYYLTTENQTNLCYHLDNKEILEVKGVGEKSGEVHHNKGWNHSSEVLFVDIEAKLSKKNCDEILNKDKLFTIEDMRKAMEEGMLIQRTINSGVNIPATRIKKYLQSLQQPTEIEVEIKMQNSRTHKAIKSESDLTWDEDGLCDRAIPMLDEEGCLILKKI